MTASATLSQEPWLSSFFGGANGLVWQTVVTPDSKWGNAMRPWLEIAAAGRSDTGLVLPLQTEEGRLSLLVCAVHRRDRAALIEQIGSFFGPSLIDALHTTETAVSEEAVRVLFERFNGGVEVFQLRSNIDLSEIMRLLSMLGSLTLRRPLRSMRVTRPFSEVRANFEQALLTADESRARRYIDELRGSGRLSAANERFLQVRLQVATGRESALAHDLPTLRWLAQADLPIRVLRDVIEALYVVHLAPLESGDSPPEVWLDAFRKAIRPHDRLFRARRGLRTPMVLRAFLLYELAKPMGTTRYAEAEALREELAKLPGLGEWADKILVWTRAHDPTASHGEANTKDTAPLEISEWAAQVPSTRALSGLLQAAVGLGTLEAAGEALATLDAYPAGLLADLSPVQRGMLDLLRRLVPPALQADPPNDWTAWAEWWVAAPGTLENTERAHAIAEQGAEQWDHLAWLGNKARVKTFGDILLAHPARFRAHLATIHASLQDLQAAANGSAEVVVILSTAVSLDTPKPSDLPMLNDWVASLVRLGAGRQLNDEMAGALRVAWSEVRALICLDWACDVIELLTSAPRTPGGELDLLFSDVLSLATSFLHRLTPTQQRVLNLLAGDFGLGLPFPQSQTTVAPATVGTSREPFDGVSIGIYTLQESLVSHLRTAIQQEFPGARIEFNHDRVATPSLEHLSRHCSVMVFAWRCSKHQAFYCVQRERPSDKPLLLPQGRGSASILRGLTEHLKGTRGDSFMPA
jgi:hypothetical protein